MMYYCFDMNFSEKKNLLLMSIYKKQANLDM